MAKKRKAGGGGPRKARRRAPDDLPDPRALESAMWGMLGGVARSDPASPAGRAQALMDQAYGEADAGKRAELARKALEAWPDCADACVLLAESAPTQKEALPLYQQ